MADVAPIPDGMEGIIPHLVVEDGAGAIDFYIRAFGAEELSRAPGPGGRLMHAAIRIGGSVVYLADDFPEMNEGRGQTPTAFGGISIGLHRYVENCDEAVDRAVAAGATVKMPPTTMFWGDRYAQVVDPWGYEWPLATHVRDVSDEEMAAAVAEMMGGG